MHMEQWSTLNICEIVLRSCSSHQFGSLWLLRALTHEIKRIVIHVEFLMVDVERSLRSSQGPGDMFF